MLYDLLFKAKDYWKPNGKMYLVINKDQGAKSLFKDLSMKYEVRIVTKNKGFLVYECK